MVILWDLVSCPCPQYRPIFLNFFIPVTLCLKVFIEVLALNQCLLIFFFDLRKKGSKTKKRMKEEETEKCLLVQRWYGDGRRHNE